MKRNVCLLASVMFALVLSFGCDKEGAETKESNTSDVINSGEKETLTSSDVTEKVTDSSNPDVPSPKDAESMDKGISEEKVPTEPAGMKLKELLNSLELPEVVVTMKDDKITREDVYNEIESQIPKMMVDKPLPPQACAQLAANINLIIDSMVSRKILLDLAAEDGIKPSPEMLLKRFDDFVKNMPPQQKQMFEAQLKAQGSSIEQRRKDAAADVNSQAAMAIDEWINEKVTPQIKVDDKKVEEYYRENQEKFKKPESVQVAHILITPEKGTPELAEKSPEEKKAFAENAELKAEKEAEAVLAELKKGGNFAEIAKKESACPSKQDGGKLPEFDKKGMMDNGGAMDATFTAASFKLKPGEISEVVKTPFGYHIIKCIEHNKESYLPIDKVKGYLKESLQKEELGKKVKTMVDAEKEKQKVVIHTEDKKENPEK